MRQGQQNRRGRGRGRKVQNPLSRNFESNGPDVKIRGTAAHIAEKYSALARDAVASGDNIGAENYYQHAEHYNRIIMAAQTQTPPGGQPQPDATNGSGQRPNRSGDQGAEAANRGNKDAAGNTAEASAPVNGAAGNGKDVAAANGGAEPETKAEGGKEDVPPDGAVA